MKKDHLLKRLLSLALVLAMLVGVFPVIGSAEGTVSFKKVDNDTVSAKLDREEVKLPEEDLQYADKEVVRVSIFLKKESTVEAGYSLKDIARNSAAMSYRAGLEKAQLALQEAIEKKFGKKLEVFWNLTLAANVISANVEYGQIAEIEKMSDVATVEIETQYLPAVVSTDRTADPNMATSSEMIGSTAAWAAGYTGAGSRIAIIDTGADTDHQSLDAQAFNYSLGVLAGQAGEDPDAYIAGLDLLDAEEIAQVLPKLNAAEVLEGVTAEDLYINSKIPFGFNYVDGDLDVTHDNDGQGEHGSHVTGIATANAYIPNGDSTFSNALDSVKVMGVAPDAQLITMKVFGKGGGAYDSDYMAAIEDAILLGCDSVNLSLGSGNPGTSACDEKYQELMDGLTEAGAVIVMSAGNSGYWAESAYNDFGAGGYLYLDDVSMDTVGSPGSYTNVLATASVENDGATGSYFLVDGEMVLYTDTYSGGYGNAAFTTVSGTQGFVYVDGVGTDAQFAAVAEELTGKIGICSRGETSFYEKGNASAANGAIATIIVNNQAGTISMDLTGYEYTQPCVSVLQSVGPMLKAVAEEKTVTLEDGSVLTYYVGELEVGEGVGSANYDSPYYTMSSFSSWGVPGSLELKPEITAPGGNIYSIFGSIQGGMGGSDQYELMSGTSMAAPQVTGMVAVVAQYIRENGLEAKTGLSARQLAQSLLMSTAEPLVDGNSGYYYPVIQQGSGLANVGSAVSADSYVLMADGQNKGSADGKIKVELGDDPDRTGSYTVSFTLHNLLDEDKEFDLYADLFTQAYFDIGDGVNYMDTWTAAMQHSAAWTVDGVAVNPDAHAIAGLDFNGDGDVDGGDVTALLEFVVDKRDALNNQSLADLNGDGEITSADAYELLKRLSAGVFTLPANASVNVSVTLTLTEDEKAYLDAYYTNGAYVEAYIYAVSRSTEEGVAGTTHSIPVLGYYGDWSDPSMFDVGSYNEYATGEETRIPYLGSAEENYYTVVYANEPDALYAFGGNPLVPDSVYMPERNAINSLNGDYIASLAFTAIRNAAASRLVVKDGDGNVFVEELLGPVDSAYYYVNGGYWMNTGSGLNLGLDPTGLPEDMTLEVALELATEYSVDAEGNVDWDALGEGAAFSMPMVIDNTAPELKDVSISLTGNTLTATAVDNQYVAAAVLYNASGTKALSYIGAKQDIQPGEAAEFVLDLTGINKDKTLLQVYDYAMNVTTYEIEVKLGQGDIIPDMIAYNVDTGHWVELNTASDYETVQEVYEAADQTFTAGTIIDHMVIASTDDGDLYVMPENDLLDMTYVTNLGAALDDMAYNPVDGEVYAVYGGYLFTVDKYTGAVAYVGEPGVLTSTLACDAEGNFYCNAYGTSDVYTFTLDTLDAPVLVATADFEGDTFVSDGIMSMEVNPNNGMVYWVACYMIEVDGYQFNACPLIEIDPVAGTATAYNDLYFQMAALLIPDQNKGGASWTAPTDEVAAVELSATELTMVCNSTASLSASVLPWNASDRTVTWTSSDENLVVVDANGNLYSMGETGTAVITAASTLDPTVTASCAVTVEKVDVTLKGTLQDADGNPLVYQWNLAEDDTWNTVVSLNTSMIAATANDNGELYIEDGISGTNSIHKVDAVTGETLETYTNTVGVPLADLAYSSYFSAQVGQDLVHALYYYYFFPCQDVTAPDGYGFNLSSYLSTYTGAGELVGVASAGYGEYDDGEGNVSDAEYVYLLDDAGYLWEFAVYAVDGGYSAAFGLIPTDLADAGYTLTYDQDYNPLSSLVMGNDGNLYFSAFDGETNVIYRLAYSADQEMFVSTVIGNVGADVWPATLYEVTANGAGDVQMPEFAKVGQIAAQAISADELTGKGASGSLNATVVTGDPAERPEGVDTADVQIKITAKDVDGVDVASNNGKFVVTYDPAVLAYEGCELLPAFNAVNDAAQGKVIIAYADLSAFAAADVVASLNFSRLDDKETKVTVAHTEVDYEEVLVIGTEEEEEKPSDPTEPTKPTKPTEPGESTQPSEPAADPDSPVTGDDFNMVLWISLLVLAAAGAAMMVILLLPKKNRRF